eukprot:SAG31_NODE_14347_length_812_cov_0.943899_2_plen_61_part_00
MDLQARLVELSAEAQQLAEQAISGDAAAVSQLANRTAEWQAELQRVVQHAAELVAQAGEM